MQQHGKVFSVLHGEISFTPEQMEYYDIRYKFEALAGKCRQQALDEFYNRFKNFSEMIDGVDNWIKEYLVRGATLAAQILAEHEHYDLDPERFVLEYFDMSRLDAASSHMKSFAQAQQDEHQTLESERADRTDAAATAWQGGGFGLDNALKGAAQAEGLNLAGAAISGTFNMIGRSIENKRQKKEQDAFFADPKTPQAFADGIYCGLANMCVDLFGYVDKKCPEINISHLTREDVAKAESLFSNITKGIIPENKIEEQCRRILSLNPLYSNIYVYVMTKYPEETPSVIKIAKWFRVHEIEAVISQKLDDFFKTLNVGTEKDVWEAQKKMAEYAGTIGLDDYNGYPPLDELAERFDREYRTVEGIEYDTRETADSQKTLWAFFNSIDLNGKYSEVEESIRKLHDKAAELKVDDAWLEDRCTSALKATQTRAAKELDDFYSTLTLDTEEQALAARKTLEEKASELELHDYTNYPPLENKLVEFDRIARTVGPREFETREEAKVQREAYEIYRSSDFTVSEDKALLAKQCLEEISGRESIDVSWLTSDVDSALKHFDELARTAFDYRYRTREECQRAAGDEMLFFLAVWSRIYKYVKANKIKKFEDYSASVQNTVRKTLNLEDGAPVFAYLNTELISSGNSGLAFTSGGICWSNGSALLSKIAANKLVKKLFSKKASELEEKNRIQSFAINWKTFLTSKAPLTGNKADVIQLEQDMEFEASRLNVKALNEMLAQIRQWAKSTSIVFTDDDKPFSPDDLQDNLPMTPLPKLK